MGFSMAKLHIHSHALHPTKTEFPRTALRKSQTSHWNTNWSQSENARRSGRPASWKVKAFPDWPLMAVMIEHVEGQRDFVVHKSVWHLSEEAMKNVCELQSITIAYFIFYCVREMRLFLHLLIILGICLIDTMYIMFTCWGCCFFGSMKDPFYDGEDYRKDGGDGTVHWVYEKQEDIEEASRAELLRQELIEEIELKVGGLRELEEASKEEELVK